MSWWSVCLLQIVRAAGGGGLLLRRRRPPILLLHPNRIEWNPRPERNCKGRKANAPPPQWNGIACLLDRERQFVCVPSLDPSLLCLVSSLLDFYCRRCCWERERETGEGDGGGTAALPGGRLAEFPFSALSDPSNSIRLPPCALAFQKAVFPDACLVFHAAVYANQYHFSMDLFRCKKKFGFYYCNTFVCL